MNTHDVVILLATYNGEKYLKRQLESIQDQTYCQFSCIVCDDGSSDHTKLIAREFCCNDTRFHLISNKSEQHGAFGNFWYLMEFAYGQTDANYFFFSDQDDFWAPRKIEKELEELKGIENKGEIASLVYCNQEITDEALNKLDIEDPYVTNNRGTKDFKRLVFRNVAPGCTMVVNRRLLNISLRFGDPSKIVMHDWWIILCAMAFGNIAYIDDKLMCYCQHRDNSIGAGKNTFQKIIKYLLNSHGAWKNRQIQANKCKAQIELLSQIALDSPYKNEIISFCKAMEKNKLLKAKYIISNKYIAARDLFTLLFI